MELLVFPSSPIAGRAARRLASALEQAPGLGGEAWQAAWRDIERAEKERAGDDAKALTAAGKRIADWKTWAESPLADPATGMAVVDALAICDRAANWASRRFASTQDPLFIATVTLAETVRRALVALGHTHVSRILVERLIDQAVDTGERNPHAVAEAAVWRTTAHPGAVWQPVPSLIWWNFGPTREGTHRSPWTVEERRELTDAGCAPDDFSVSGRAASQAWERSVLNTQDRLLLVSCGLACNDEESLHPLAHRLAPALENLADRVGLEAALNSPTLALAGVDIPRAAATRAPLPAARAFWSTPSGFAARRDALVESASSIEALLSCQLMWALKYVARLRPGRVRSIPDANRLLGNLAHAIAHEVFLPGAPPSPSDAKTRAAEILEGTIDQLAAPLRLPELAEELTVARRRLPEAMAALAETLAKNGLIIEATEKQVSGTFEGILALRGAVDLVARDPAGQPVIIDLKWTRYEKPRLQELEQGNAIQLATYGKLVATDAPYRAGYFLLNQRQFATLEGAGLIGRGVIGARTFPETWAAIVASWRQWRVAADAGTLVSMGVEGFADHAPADLGIEREVRCDRCDYATICRRRGQA